ncbi:MAG TPA: energy transducer TonB, partial [Gemmatimonadaceae bacterium]
MCSRALLLMLVVPLASLRAQGVYAGQVVDPKTRAPLMCVDVSLEDSSAHEVAHALTMSDGAFQFDSPPKGSYRPRFSVWSHAPVYGEYETLDPTAERARLYQIDFGPRTTGKSKLSPDTTDAPPGKPLTYPGIMLLYPQKLIESHVEGEVSMRYAVDSAGWVVQSSIQVLQTSHRDFATETVRYLRRAQFETARR